MPTIPTDPSMDPEQSLGTVCASVTYLSSISLSVKIRGCNLEHEIFLRQWGETPLSHAVMQQNAEVVNALLTAGSTVDEKDYVSCAMNCVYN